MADKKTKTVALADRTANKSVAFAVVSNYATENAIPVEGVTVLGGKPYINITGLLYKAKDLGLKSLKLEIIQLAKTKDDTAIVKCVVETQDGTFEDIGFGSKESIKMTTLHNSDFINMTTITRAKSRALRNATSFGLASVEEMPDFDPVDVDAVGANAGEIKNGKAVLDVNVDNSEEKSDEKTPLETTIDKVKSEKSEASTKTATEAAKEDKSIKTADKVKAENAVIISKLSEDRLAMLNDLTIENDIKMMNDINGTFSNPLFSLEERENQINMILDKAIADRKKATEEESDPAPAKKTNPLMAAAKTAKAAKSEERPKSVLEDEDLLEDFGIEDPNKPEVVAKKTAVVDDAWGDDEQKDEEEEFESKGVTKDQVKQIHSLYSQFCGLVGRDPEDKDKKHEAFALAIFGKGTNAKINSTLDLTYTQAGVLIDFMKERIQVKIEEQKARQSDPSI